jgi:hypothetical protein
MQPAVVATAGSREIALVGPVTAAALEAAWLGGRTGEMPALAAPALALAAEARHRTSQAELTRYLQRGGHAGAAPDGAAGPWAAGVAGALAVIGQGTAERSRALPDPPIGGILH